LQKTYNLGVTTRVGLSAVSFALGQKDAAAIPNAITTLTHKTL